MSVLDISIPGPVFFALRNETLKNTSEIGSMRCRKIACYLPTFFLQLRPIRSKRAGIRESFESSPLMGELKPLVPLSQSCFVE